MVEVEGSLMLGADDTRAIAKPCQVGRRLELCETW